MKCSRRRRIGRCSSMVVLLLISRSPDCLRGQSLPAPTGPHPVAVTRLVLVDSARPEPQTADPRDLREIVVQLWYPGESRSGSRARYVVDAELWRESLGARVVGRLAMIRTNARWNVPADRTRAWPVLVLSPAAGNDPGFYSGLGEELASRGFVVAALGHPYERPSLRLSGGRVARPPETAADGDAFTAARDRILWRAQDLRFALARLSRGLDAIPDLRVDTRRAIVLGHSRGGVAALEACKRDAGFRACVNLDGGVLGGPYYDDSIIAGPRAPMLWLQAYHPAPADSQLALWNMTRAQWDSFDIRANQLIARSLGGGWRVVIPDSVHQAFSDLEWALADATEKVRAFKTMRTVRELMSYYAAAAVASRKIDFERFLRERRILSAQRFPQR